MPAINLILGSRNRKKLQEITELLIGLSVEVCDLSGYPDAPEVEEDGNTFEANARKKASELAKALGHRTLGEDSGLVVPVLKGEPGVYSARYCGRHGDDDANNDLLLQKLANVPEEKRDAYYVCSVALSDPQGNVQAVAEGRCHGRIARELRGTNGFGYDPLFIVPEYHKTFGELSPRVKSALSHRARGITQLVPDIMKLMHAPSGQ